MTTHAATAVAKGQAALTRSLYEAYNNRDIERIGQNSTADSEWIHLPLAYTHRGPDGAREFVQDWIRAFPDSRIEIVNVMASDGWCVSECRFRGTHEGPLSLPQGPLQPTNRKVDVPFCEVREFRDDKVVKCRTYYDAATLLRQLGAIS